MPSITDSGTSSDTPGYTDVSTSGDEATLRTPHDSNRRPATRGPGRILSVVAVGCISAGIALGVLQTTGSSPLAFLDEDPRTVTNEEVIRRVAELAELPADTEPIIATIEDVDSLIEADEFYVGAENGDRVIVYATESRALLYSVARDELVKDGSLDGNP